MDDVSELSPEAIAEAVSWRRHLHQHPELAFNERRTSDFIASKLSQFGLTVHRGLGGTGVVGTLTRGLSHRAIAIRADMDALPIAEQSGIAYASCNPSVMHACGHDGHVATLLAVASVCARMPNLDGTVHFVFQPAEESEGGGRRMVEDGLFRLFPVETIFALHNWPALPLGTCVARDGPMMAALGLFTVEIAGRGCHGAMPHQGTDSILAACQLVSALQSIVSRNIDPLQSSVVSVTQIRAGDAWSVLPDTCTIRGTTRWFDETIGDIVERRLSEISNSVANAFGCTARVHYERRFPATINDAAVARFVRELATTSPCNLKVVDAPPSMATEDFAYMLNAVPGCYLWLGTSSSDQVEFLHSSRYDFNDDLLPIGARLWIALVKRKLASL